MEEIFILLLIISFSFGKYSYVRFQVLFALVDPEIFDIKGDQYFPTF